MELDLKATQAAIVDGLPLRIRWMINETPLDFDFSIARQGLHAPTNDMVGRGKKEWFDLLIFGKYDHAEGGGASPFLGIHNINGTIYGLDLEREIALFLLNSSVDRFICTFHLLNKFLDRGQPLPLDAEARIIGIDPEAYPRSDWRLLFDSLVCGEPGTTPDSAK